MHARLVMVSMALVSACGAGAAPEARHHLSPDDPALEVDPQPCTVDGDCMIGTPRNCCASFCAADQVAWSRQRWADYQSDCAVVECAVLEDAACPPEAPSSVVAVCERERCVLRPL